jgi:type IV fimbrial biogenesis protein FimT
MRIFSAGTCRENRARVRRARFPGRTLMELLVILMILGLAAGLVVPRFAGASSQAALKAGARDVITAIGYARNQAASEGRSYRIEVDPSSGELQTLCFDPEQDSEEPYVPHVGILGGTMTLPAGVSFGRVAVGEDAGGTEVRGRSAVADTSGKVTIQFSPDGTVDQTIIVIANEDGEELTLSVDQFTGRARVLGLQEAEELRDDLGLE